MMKMTSLIYLDQSCSFPASSLFVRGEMRLHQIGILSATNEKTEYNVPLINDSSIYSVSDVLFQTILDNNWQRNGTNINYL
jgi:hypothetical protein